MVSPSRAPISCAHDVTRTSFCARHVRRYDDHDALRAHQRVLQQHRLLQGTRVSLDETDRDRRRTDERRARMTLSRDGAQALGFLASTPPTDARAARDARRARHLETRAQTY